jgi:hypothetical protein
LYWCQTWSLRLKEEYGVEEDISTKEGRNDRTLQKNCIMRRFVIGTAQQIFG